MTDAITKTPLRVSTDDPTLPYIEAPVGQIDEIRALLSSRGIRFWVDEDVISFNGGPQLALINLSRGADAAAIQAILDSVR